MEKIAIDIELLKEASEVITSLKDEVSDLRKKADAQDRELNSLKMQIEREKIASALEEKNLVPVEIIEKIKEGSMPDSEYEKYKTLASVDTSLTNYEINSEKTASVIDYKVASDMAVTIRKNDRGEMFLRELQSLKN